jgi:hypothetical protein
MDLYRRPAIDVHHSVIERSRRRTWRAQIPQRCDRIALLVCAMAPAALLIWPLLDLRNEAFVLAALLCGGACLISSEWKTLGLASLAIAALLATSGCVPSEISSRATGASPSSEMSAADTSIREATRYQDPRLGYTPKKIDIVKGEAVGGDKEDAVHAD